MADKPGYYQIEVPGLAKEPPVTYYVQLPPEYDPYRLYPTIVTLNGGGPRAEQQIDWWAGASGSDGTRTGQATRHGYIVVAPGVDRRAPEAIRLLGPRTRRRAELAARRLPAVRHRHRPGLTSPAIRWAATPPGTSAWRIPICGRA